MRGQSPLICNNWRHKHHLVNPTITLKYVYRQASLIAQLVKNLPAVQETWVQFLSWEDPLEKEMATHSSILTWRIPWTEEPGRLQSMRSQESDTTYGLNHHHHHHTDTQNLSIWGFRGHIDHAVCPPVILGLSRSHHRCSLFFFFFFFSKTGFIEVFNINYFQWNSPF